MNVIEVNNNNFINTSIKSSNIENTIYFNDPQFKIYVTQEDFGLVIDTDYVLIDDNNFIKLELIFSSDGQSLLPGCFSIYGTQHNDVYTETLSCPLIDANTYYSIQNKFSSTFNNTQIVNNFLFNLPQIYYELLSLY